MCRKRSNEKERKRKKEKKTFRLLQVLYVKQQVAKRRIKRDFIMLPFPSSKSRTVSGDESFDKENRQKMNSHHTLLSRATFTKNDPKWPDMWYLVCIINALCTRVDLE